MREQKQETPLTDYQVKCIDAIFDGIELYEEEESYNEYLTSVRADEFAANPFNKEVGA